MDIRVQTALVKQILNAAPAGKFGAHRAVLELSDGRLTDGYVKILDVRSIAVEILCAVAGRLAGLPIPEPVLALIEHPSGQWGLAFASLSVGADNLEHPVNTRDPTILAELVAWQKIHRAACFDEWVGNSDRHPGNVLRSGDGGFWLIDHNLAMPASLAPHELATLNQLFQVLSSMAASEHDRRQLRHAAESESVDLVSTDMIALTLAATNDIDRAIPDRRALMDFVSARAAHLLALCKARTPTAQRGLFDGN